VAVLGTTISPYPFVWQAAQEVEEHRGEGLTKPGAPWPQKLYGKPKHFRIIWAASIP